MTRRKDAVFLRFVLLAGWVLTIVWLSLASVPPAANVELFGYDKLLHASAYFTLTLLAGWAFSGITTMTWRFWIMLAVSAMVIGGMMETAQALLTSTRTAEVFDMAANGIGAVTALLLAKNMKRSDISKR